MLNDLVLIIILIILIILISKNRRWLFPQHDYLHVLLGDILLQAINIQRNLSYANGSIGRFPNAMWPLVLGTLFR